MAENTTSSGKWQKRVLVASLALNLLVIGAVAGLAISGGTKGPPSRFDLTAGPITRAMEGDRRDRVRDALRDSDAFRPATRAQMRADMEVLLETLRAETFDADGFRDALSRQRSRLRAGQEAALNAVTVEIADMSLQERSAFADRLERYLRDRSGARSDRD